MSELPYNPIPTANSAPRGHDIPDVRTPIWRDQFNSIDQNGVRGNLLAGISQEEREALAAASPLTPPPTPEQAAREEVERRLPAELGRIAELLTREEIDKRVDQLLTDAESSPVTTELGATQFGFTSAEQARLAAPDGEPQLAQVQPDGHQLTLDEAFALVNKAGGSTGLTSEEERLRYNTVELSKYVLDATGNPVLNPYYNPDPMSQTQARINLQAHRSGAVPRAPGLLTHHNTPGAQNRISRLISDREDRRARKHKIRADKALVATKGPHASQDTYGGGRRFAERRDERAEENLSRNQFSRRGAVFKYFDENTGRHRNYVVEGAHARQAVWNDPNLPGHAGTPLYFLCEDGSVGEPVALDEFGNITNRPVVTTGSTKTTRSTAMHPSGETTSLLCDVNGNPIHVPRAFEHLDAGSTRGKSTGVFRQGSELVIYRPTWTREEVEQAHRHGITSLAAPGYSGTPEELVGPRYTTVDSIILASALEDRSLGQNRQPRIVRDREAVLKNEFVWKSEEEMTDDEFNNPAAYPPEIVSGETGSDNGVFVHFLGEQVSNRGATRVESSLDSPVRMPVEALPGDVRAYQARQRQMLETRDQRAVRRARK